MVGGYPPGPPPARPKLLKSPRMHLVPPGRVLSPGVAAFCGGAHECACPLLNVAAPPPLLLSGTVGGRRGRARARLLSDGVARAGLDGRLTSQSRALA